MRGRINPLKPLKRARIEEEGHGQNKVSVTVRLKQAIQEQEQIFVRIVDERSAQVRRIEEQMRDIQAQLVEARQKHTEAEMQLARFRDRNHLHMPVGNSLDDLLDMTVTTGEVVNKSGAQPPGGTKCEGKEQLDAAMNKKPVLVIPGDNLNESHEANIPNPSNNSGTVDDSSCPPQSCFTDQGAFCVKTENESPVTSSRTSSGHGSVVSREIQDLVLRIGDNLAPSFLEVVQHRYVPSQHRRKLRNLCVNATSGFSEDFATSALDGIINTWKIRDKGEGIMLCSSFQCLSSGQKRWPEDLAWHPSGKFIFGCYSADGNDDQVSVIDLSTEGSLKFLKDRPHEKGLINSLTFLPWKDGTSFSTAGCDHAVVIWNENEDGFWQAKTLHRALHSSAVMNAVGMRHKPIIVSVGMDKRIIGFNTEHVREEFRHVLDSRALRLLSNPVDPNLYMVQTGTPGAQLRLFDIRSYKHELHAFGWRQDNTESQSALIHPSWSNNGLHIASGSADPRIHLFDIRYKGKEPSQTIKAHQKRVFKAAWHHTFPLLVSISSDLNIGLVKLAL